MSTVRAHTVLQLRLMDLLYNYDASTRLIKLFEKTKVGYNNFAEGGRHFPRHNNTCGFNVTAAI